MLNEKDVDALTSLGLTGLQARVYFVLANLGKATTKTLAKNTEIARQDIYRLTTELQEMGLIEKIMSTPNEYKAISLEEGVNILLQKKQKENVEANKKAAEMLQRQKTETIKKHPLENNTQFSLIPENNALTLKIKKEVETAKNSIDVICSWKKFSQGFSELGAELDAALKRGATCSFILEKPSETQTCPKTAQNLMKKLGFKVRTFKQLPDCTIAIYDNKEILITTSAQGNFMESPALWSKNPGFISVFREFFDIKWKESKEYTA